MLIESVIVFVSLPLLLQVTAYDSPPWDHVIHHPHGGNAVCGPTVRQLPTIFVDSCREIGLSYSKCNAASNSFIGAFADKDPQTVTRSDYRIYFNHLPITVQKNQNLFWSGTRPFVDEISTGNYGVTVVSSGNADSSLIINTIEKKTKSTPYWCGKKGEYIDYTTPHCDCTPTFNFWDEFSELFAKAAIETAFFLTNGERPDGKGAYSADSTFAKIEIPALRKGIVTQIVVMVIARGGSTGETCEKPRQDSLVLLQSTLASKGFGYRCYDIVGDPNNVSVNNVRYLSQFAANIIKQFQNRRLRAGRTRLSVRVRDFYENFIRNILATY